MYEKVLGEVVTFDTDILFVDEADIVVGDRDLVQAEQAEEEGPKDEEEADSSFWLHKSHLI